MGEEKGIFTISLDTELCWGMFDQQDISKHSEQYRKAPQVIDEICDLFSKYDIKATWAVVAHLFEDCGGEHPEFEELDSETTDDWYSKLPCQNGVEKGLWYSPNILESIESCSPDQDIGLHGYTHKVLGNESCSKEAANREIDRAMEVMNELDIEPKSFVYPRNRIGHRDVLSDHGIEVYRGVDEEWYEKKNISSRLKKGMRYIDEALERTPPTVTPNEKNGLVEVPGSQVFRPNHGGWEYTPQDSQVKRAMKGLDRAAQTGEVFHLWFHPFNLSLDKEELLASFEDVLSYASELRAKGEIEMLSLYDIGKEYTQSDGVKYN